jgi:transcriptional regulator with XRE-family HTH domain
MTSARTPHPGERARIWRRIHGRTLRWLSSKTGLAQGSLSRIERGEQHLRPEDVELIASAYGISVARFYGAITDETGKSEGQDLSHGPTD